MLKLGEKIISDLYLGDKRIAKAYLGDKLVFQAGKPIFLEYITFDGASYIDTGIVPTNETGAYVRLSRVTEDDMVILGCRESSSTNTRVFPCASAWGSVGCGWNKYLYLFRDGCLDYSSSDLRIERNLFYEQYTNYLNSRVVRVIEKTSNLDVTSVELGNLTFTPTFPMFLGGVNIAGSLSAKFKGNISQCTITEGNTIVRDLKPCIDPKGVVCFYDMVTKKYFYNQGTGTLIAGNKINFVDYIIFDGDSYIDTLFKPNPHTTRTVLDCMLLDNTSSGGQGVFGSRPTSTSSINSMNIWFNTSDVPQKLRFDCTGDYQSLNTNIVDITQRLLIDCLDNSATVNGVTYSANVDKSNATYLNYSMYLGNFNNVGKPYTKGCNMNVYGFTIYDNGVLIQDLKPCIVNGVACFYDMVTGKLFTNAGTGTLKPSGRFVKSILFDGASFIDTGIAHQTCTVECDIRFEETGTRQLMGFATSTAQYWGKGANSSTIEYFSGTNVLDRTLVTLQYNTDDPTAPTIIKYADGRTSGVSQGTSVSPYTYTIGAVGTTVKSYWCTCEVWGNKFTNADGELIQDLRPYVDEDGVPCFYDTVTNVKFYNKGTGTLSYTE